MLFIIPKTPLSRDERLRDLSLVAAAAIGSSLMPRRAGWPCDEADLRECSMAEVWPDGSMAAGQLNDRSPPRAMGLSVPLTTSQSPRR